VVTGVTFSKIITFKTMLHSKELLQRLITPLLACEQIATPNFTDSSNSDCWEVEITMGAFNSDSTTLKDKI
jgi:hypothetical protein